MSTSEDKARWYKNGLKKLTPKRISRKHFRFIVIDLLTASWVDEMGMQWVEDLVRHIHKVDPELFDTLPKELRER